MKGHVVRIRWNTFSEWWGAAPVKDKVRGLYALCQGSGIMVGEEFLHIGRVSTERRVLFLAEVVRDVLRDVLKQDPKGNRKRRVWTTALELAIEQCFAPGGTGEARVGAQTLLEVLYLLADEEIYRIEFVAGEKQDRLIGCFLDDFYAWWTAHVGKAQLPPAWFDAAILSGRSGLFQTLGIEDDLVAKRLTHWLGVVTGRYEGAGLEFPFSYFFKSRMVSGRQRCWIRDLILFHARQGTFDSCGKVSTLPDPKRPPP